VKLGQHSNILYAGPTLRPTYKGSPPTLGQEIKGALQMMNELCKDHA